MLKLVVGLILLMSLPAISLAGEPAAPAETTTPAVTAPEAPAAVPPEAVPEAPAASPEVVKPAAIAPTATPAALPPGYQPWKSDK